MLRAGRRAGAAREGDEQAKAQVDDIVAEASYINEAAKTEQPAADGE